MGMSLDAYLYYGIPIEEDSEFDYESFERIWGQKNGPKVPDNGETYDSVAYQEYISKLKEWKNSPQYITLGYCGGYDFVGRYLYSFLRFSVYGSNHLKIDYDITKHQPEIDKQMKLFCEMFGLEYTQPAWYLCVNYS